MVIRCIGAPHLPVFVPRHPKSAYPLCPPENLDPRSFRNAFDAMVHSFVRHPATERGRTTTRGIWFLRSDSRLPLGAKLPYCFPFNILRAEGTLLIGRWLRRLLLDKVVWASGKVTRRRRRRRRRSRGGEGADQYRNFLARKQHRYYCHVCRQHR